MTGILCSFIYFFFRYFEQGDKVETNCGDQRVTQLGDQRIVIATKIGTYLPVHFNFITLNNKHLRYAR